LGDESLIARRLFSVLRLGQTYGDLACRVSGPEELVRVDPRRCHVIQLKKLSILPD
jgi:hypothetical protein